MVIASFEASLIKEVASSIAKETTVDKLCKTDSINSDNSKNEMIDEDPIIEMKPIVPYRSMFIFNVENR